MMFKNFFYEPKYLFLLSIILAFIFPSFARKIEFLIVPTLIAMMTFSIKEINLKDIKESNKKQVFILILMNYLLLSGILILLTFWLVPDGIYQNSLFVWAIMPPAVGIVGLSYMLRANVSLSLATETSAYLLSLIIIPLSSWFLFGEAVNPWQVLKAISLLIILPFMLSRVIHIYEKYYKPISKETVNCVVDVTLALGFFIVIGINRNVFISEFYSLGSIILIIVGASFILGSIIHFVLKKMRVEKSVSALYVLYGTYKNTGLSVAIVILLFGVEATVPQAIQSVFSPLYILFLESILCKV